MMDHYSSKREEKQSEIPKRGLNLPVWVLVIVVLISFAGGIFFDHYLGKKYDGLFFALSKVKNIFLSTVLGDEPQFYYLDIEMKG